MIEDMVPKKSTQGGHKEIDTQRTSQQLARVSMPPILQVSPVGEQSNGQNTGWVAKLKMYTSYVS